ncbi:hypothetical protein AVAK2825_11430 [Acidovorax sp. SUPP2825]|nr:hypothetical protein AVAK2825_11430 [Acidovorax sp. SUPP2825]
MTALTSAALTELPTDKELVLKVIPMPADCNANGDIFGGWVMAQVDLAGSVLPARYVQGRMATVAVNEFVFKQPVRVGDILSFFSAVTRAPDAPRSRWRSRCMQSAFQRRAGM